MPPRAWDMSKVDWRGTPAPLAPRAPGTPAAPVPRACGTDASVERDEQPPTAVLHDIDGHPVGLLHVLRGEHLTRVAGRDDAGRLHGADGGRGRVDPFQDGQLAQQDAVDRRTRGPGWGRGWS